MKLEKFKNLLNLSLWLKSWLIFVNVSGCSKRQWLLLFIEYKFIRLSLLIVLFRCTLSFLLFCSIWFVIFYKLYPSFPLYVCVHFLLISSVWLIYLQTTLLRSCIFMIVMYSWWVIPFINIEYPSLSCLMLLAWNFISSDITITTPTFLKHCLVFFYIPLFLFSLSHFILLYYKQARARGLEANVRTSIFS